MCGTVSAFLLRRRDVAKTELHGPTPTHSDIQILRRGIPIETRIKP